MKIISSIILVLLLQSCSNKTNETNERKQLEDIVKMIHGNDSIMENKSITETAVDTVDYSNIKLVNEPLKEQIISFIYVLRLQPNDRKESILEIVDEKLNDIIFKYTYAWPAICHNDFKGILDFKPNGINIFLFQKGERLNEAFFVLEKECDCTEEKTPRGNLLILNDGYRVEPYDATLGVFYTYFHFKKVDGKFEFYKEYRDPRTVPKL